MQYDRALVTAIVSVDWQVETHFFHLPFNEITIILQDIQILFSLLINGDAVYLQDVTQKSRPWHTLLETLTGYKAASANMDDASRVRIHSITRYLQNPLQLAYPYYVMTTYCFHMQVVRYEVFIEVLSHIIFLF